MEFNSHKAFPILLSFLLPGMDTRESYLYKHMKTKKYLENMRYIQTDKEMKAKI